MNKFLSWFSRVQANMQKDRQVRIEQSLEHKVGILGFIQRNQEHKLDEVSKTLLMKVDEHEHKIKTLYELVDKLLKERGEE